MSRTKPDPELLERLSRHERRIMKIVCAKGTTTSAEVLAAVADRPSYPAMRAMMRILVVKGLLKHRVGLRYVFEPVATAGRVCDFVVSRLVKSLFENSPGPAAALLPMQDPSVSTSAPVVAMIRRGVVLPSGSSLVWRLAGRRG